MKSVKIKHEKLTKNKEINEKLTCIYLTDLETAEQIRVEAPRMKQRRVDIYKKYHEK